MKHYFKKQNMSTFYPEIFNLKIIRIKSGDCFSVNLNTLKRNISFFDKISWDDAIEDVEKKYDDVFESNVAYNVALDILCLYKKYSKTECIFLNKEIERIQKKL